MLEYFWLIPLFPCLGALINGLVGIKFFNRKSVNFFALGMPLASLVLSSIATIQLLSLPPGARTIKHVLFQWIPAGLATLRDGSAAAFSINLSFAFDPLTAVMVTVVCGVGFLIHVYSTGYMEKDRSYVRFFTYLNLFMFSMLVLVLASNLAVMFVGWEGVGLCSYLLIGFWYQKDSAANAGKKAFLVNRIGDLGFLLGIMLTFFTVGSLEFSDIGRFIESGYLTAAMATVIGLLLFVGAAGKSAQLPLYVWLPDAMEGPTPVSALIHAATMVTAGVYMVARMNILYSVSSAAVHVVAVIGALTALYAASMALVQHDLKRVLAYSTISQLGYMMLGCGSKVFSAGIFHLATHAFFKALLFLAAGSVMHALSGELDIRKMGNLKKYLPMTYPVFLIGAIAISGVPGFSGFFSKDEILLSAFLSGRTWIWLIGVITAGLTAFYMFRLVFMVFHGKERMADDVRHHIHESPKTMTVPLLLLAVFSVSAGYIGLPKALLGGAWFSRFLANVIHDEHHRIPLTTEYALMLISVLAAAFGIYLAWLFYVKRTDLPGRLAARIKPAYALLYHKYYIDEIYDAVFVKGTLLLGKIASVFDTKAIDGLVNGAGSLTRGTGKATGFFDEKAIDGSLNTMAKGFGRGSVAFRKAQTGYVQNYLLAIIFGVVIIIALSLFI